VAPFELIPAIDLLEGRCVRLARGDYAAATVYDDDPGAVAARFAAAGARRIHVVDLDAAKSGRRANAVARAGGVPVQLGGGIRRLADVEEALALGAERVVIGTAALRDPELVREAARRFPGRVVVGLDARDGRVAVEGWLATSEARTEEVARRFEDAGVAALVHTDISRDGMGTGPNLEATAALAAQVSIPVIASGGVGSLADIRRAATTRAQMQRGTFLKTAQRGTLLQAEREGRSPRSGLAGLIVGRALYTGAVDLAEALAVVSEALGDGALHEGGPAGSAEGAAPSPGEPPCS